MMSAPIDLRNASSSASKSAVLDSQNNPIAIPPMPDYSGRILAYTATAGIIVSGILQGVFGMWMLWLLAGALTWPHIVHQVTRKTFLRNSPRIRQKMLLVDCAIGGGFVGCLGLIAIPSVAVVLMLMFSCLIVGGIRQWLSGTIIMAGSGAIGVAIVGTRMPMR